jgi:hypothetical protein
MDRRIVIFYHTCQLPGWEDMFAEQMHTMESVGLLDACEHIFIHINGDTIPSILSDKITYMFNPHPELEETDTLRAIKDFAYSAESDGAHILYTHMKGIKSQITPAWPANPLWGTMFVTNWRRMMEHYVLGEWQICSKLLHYSDTVGCNYATAPRRHWSGGMWWANPDYIRTLDHNLLETPSRWDREFWIGSRADGGTFTELHRSNVDHYNVNYPPELWSPIPGPVLEMIKDHDA